MKTPELLRRRIFFVPAALVMLCATTLPLVANAVPFDSFGEAVISAPVGTVYGTPELAVHAAFIQSEFDLTGVIPVGIGLEANAMCTPVIMKCGCGKIVNPKGGCKPGLNKFMCPCAQTTFGFVSSGFCMAPSICKAMATSDGMFDGLLGMLAKTLGLQAAQMLLQNLMGGGSTGGDTSGGSSGDGTTGSSGCTSYYQTSDISKLSDPCATYVASVSDSININTGSSGGCDPLAAALGQCGGTSVSSTAVGTGVGTGTSGGCDPLSAALGLCGGTGATSTSVGTGTGGTGVGTGSGFVSDGGSTSQCDGFMAFFGLCIAGTEGVNTSTGDNTNTGTGNTCNLLSAALGLCGGTISGSGGVGNSWTDNSGTGNSGTGGIGSTGGSTITDTNRCDVLSQALGVCGCSFLDASLGLCRVGSGDGTTVAGSGSAGTGPGSSGSGQVCNPLSEALGECGFSGGTTGYSGTGTGVGTSTNTISSTVQKSRTYTVIYTSSRQNPDGTYTVTYTIKNSSTGAIEKVSTIIKKPRIIYQPVTGFGKAGAQGGARGDIVSGYGDATVIAGTRDEEKNIEVSGFYGSQTFGNQGSQGLVARWCRARPWAGGFLAKIVDPSFFDGICKARGYQVGEPPAPTPPAPTTSLQQISPTKATVSVPTKPATSTPIATSTPRGPPRVDIWAVPPTVPLGTRTSIFWSTQNVVDCRETSSDGQFSHKTLSGGSATVPIIALTTFTITCLVSDGTTVTKSVTVGLKL